MRNRLRRPRPRRTRTPGSRPEYAAARQARRPSGCGRLRPDHLQAFHERIVGDVDEWAGQLRTVTISKATCSRYPSTSSPTLVLHHPSEAGSAPARTAGSMVPARSSWCRPATRPGGSTDGARGWRTDPSSAQADLRLRGAVAVVEDSAGSASAGHRAQVACGQLGVKPSARSTQLERSWAQQGPELGELGELAVSHGRH